MTLYTVFLGIMLLGVITAQFAYASERGLGKRRATAGKVQAVSNAVAQIAGSAAI